MDWEKYRNEDGSLDLIRAYQDERAKGHRVAELFLKVTQRFQPIKSRQAAAIALTQAWFNQTIRDKVNEIDAERL
jgi:hypothetical protein